VRVETVILAVRRSAIATLIPARAEASFCFDFLQFSDLPCHCPLRRQSITERNDRSELDSSPKQQIWDESQTKHEFFSWICDFGECKNCGKSCDPSNTAPIAFGLPAVVWRKSSRGGKSSKFISIVQMIPAQEGEDQIQIFQSV
jgi:hypothetical protein